MEKFRRDGPQGGQDQQPDAMAQEMHCCPHLYQPKISYHRQPTETPFQYSV